MGILNILLYVLLIYMVYRSYTLSKKTKKNRELINIIVHAEDPDTYFEQLDAYIEKEQEPQYVAKAKVLRLWGCILHDRMDSFAEGLQDVNIDDMIQPDKSGNPSVEVNEDSFFYLYLAMPNMLHYKGMEETRALVREKLAPYTDKLSNQLVVALAEACDDFYDNKNDRGREFFNKVLEGDYAGYVYSKSLIRLYKMIISANLYKLAEEENDTEKLDELKGSVEEFAKSGVGARWLNSIGVKLESTETEEEKPSLDEYKAAEAPAEEEEKEERPSLDDFRPAPPIEKKEEEE